MTLLATGLFNLLNYWVYVSLMMIGLYAVIAKTNLVKKVIGLSLFQTGIFIFYISMGVVSGATTPITWTEGERLRLGLSRAGVPADRAAAALLTLEADGIEAARAGLEPLAPAAAAIIDEALARPYTNPLPHVLILTAIVVSVSTMAVALAIVMEIKAAYGTIESDEIVTAELEAARAARS
ncbi:MAG: cation:proton antiporter subunit C [Planctomycetes bacterium]|nr:cation:proton antiporter subunit C [Planctomycetota bacterium]